nr:outer membrane beta-barrel protein [candidate division Zixibacteria bacterium]
MRKILLLTLLAALLAVPVAQATQLGIGAIGGINIPVAQEDQGSGTIYGFKAKVSVIPGLVLEPNINFAKFGDASFDFGTRPGSKVTSFGIDALLGAGMGVLGLRMYGIVGAGYYSVARDYDDDTKKLGWSTGFGFELGISESVGVDLRGKLDIISSEGGGTKKSAAVAGGLNYYFGY